MRKFWALFLVISTFLAFPSIQIFALEEIGSTSFDIETSDVMEDLSRTYIDGKKFDAAEYPLNSSVDYMLLLNVIEYAWDDYSAGGDSSAYGLYFYLYNPSADKPLTRGGHQIQMSVSKTDFYVKYFLKLVSASDDNRFLKFKLENPSAVFARLWSDIRTYKISGIEIETKVKGVKDYKIAGSYTFTGRQASKTLACKTDTLTTIELDLHSTYYRLDSSAQGKYFYSQLDSVYFALDDWILEEYGEVYSISFQYSKRLFNTLVSWDEIASNIGWEVANGYNSIHHVADYAAVSYFGNMLSPYFGWRWEGLLGNVSNKDFIMAGFYVEDKDVYLSPDELLAFAYENDMFSKAENYNTAFSPVFKRDEITIEDNLKLLSIQSNYNWAQQLLKYGLFGGVWGAQDSVDITEPIYHVKSEDFEASDISEKLYIDPHDVEQ